MKKHLFFLALFLFAFMVAVARGETITWNNATTYTDNTAIAPAAQATMTSRIYHSATGNGTDWSLFQTILSGGQSWTGALPSAYAKGSTIYVSMTNTIPAEGTPSAYAPAVSYVIPYVAPQTPVTIHITRP